MRAHLRLGLMHILYALEQQKLLEPPHLGIALGSGLNNSSRTLCSVCGSCIRFAGTGGSGGHIKTCLAGGPTVAQDEVASAKISNSAFCSSFGISFPLLISGGNRVLCCRQLIFVAAGSLGCEAFGLAIFDQMLIHLELGYAFSIGLTLVVPSNASTAETENRGEDQSKDQAQVHGSPLTHSLNSA